MSITVLHKFTHGIGDAVAFTTVLKALSKHHPDWLQDVVSLRGKHTAFFGLVRHSYIDGEQRRERYGSVFNHTWPECWASLPNSPGTKAALCLRSYQLPVVWEDMTYTVNVGPGAQERAEAYVNTLPVRPIVIIHYQGNTSQSNKNLDHNTIWELCQWLLTEDCTPVILDWDHRSPLPDNKTVFSPRRHNPLWAHDGNGDVETTAALINQACLFIGVDSGPQKVAFSTQTPTVAVWTAHHPYHYCDNAPQAVHLVPDNHPHYIHGNKHTAMDFFSSHYEAVMYPRGEPLQAIKHQAMIALHHRSSSGRR